VPYLDTYWSNSFSPKYDPSVFGVLQLHEYFSNYPIFISHAISNFQKCRSLAVATLPGAVAPIPKEKSCHPEPFTKRSEYETFRRQLTIFFRANGDVYPSDLDKIYFTLTLMTEGMPGQWAQNFIEKVEAQTIDGNIPDTAWGTFEEFQTSLKESFADPNKGKTAYNNLKTL